MWDQLFLPRIWIGSCDGAAPVRLLGTACRFSHASVGGLGGWDMDQVVLEKASFTVILGDMLAVMLDRRGNIVRAKVGLGRRFEYQVGRRCVKLELKATHNKWCLREGAIAIL